MLRPSSNLLSLATCCLVFQAAGCQSGYRSNAAQLVKMEQSGRYVEAASAASQQAEANRDSEKNRVIYLLEAGRACQIAGEIDESLRYYAEAYEIVRPYLDTKAENRITEGIATTVVNQTLAEYKATVAERIMLNTLQALNEIAAGDPAAARVELNRARDWQQDAVARAEEEIDAAQKKLAETAEEKDIPQKSFDVPRELREATSGIGDISGYADWRNPFTSWLRGVFLMANAGDDGDLGNARFDLRDVLGMVPGTAPLVEPDLEAIESRSITPRTWVVLMSGLAPTLEEFRLDIPIPIGNVNYVAAAFPILKLRPEAADGLVVEAEGETVEGVMLADMDAVVAADYDRRIGLIVSQEILSAALKTASTYAASQAGGDDYGGLAQLAGMLYQAVSTAADLRTWQTLPKSIRAVGMPTPASGTVSIRLRNGRLLADADVVPGAFNLVVVVLPSGAAPTAAVQSLKLDEPASPNRPGQEDGSSST